MSRSGYVDDFDDPLQLGRWRAQVRSATRGKRGQAFLREMLAALDAMPNKRLVAGHLRADGEVCALGCIGAARGIELEKLDPEDFDSLAPAFGIAAPLVREIEWNNDEGAVYWKTETPEQRWQRMRNWVVSQITESTERTKA